MEGTLKRLIEEIALDSTAKRPKPATAEDYLGFEEEDEDAMLEGLIADDDETLQELRKLLEPAPPPPLPTSEVVIVDEGKKQDCQQRAQSEPLPVPSAVKFISNTHSSLNRPLLLSSYYTATIGNEESCGSSISDSDSSVMASVDTGTFDFNIMNLANLHVYHHPSSSMGVSGGGTWRGYSSSTLVSEDEVARGWIAEKDIAGFQKNATQAMAAGGGGACASMEAAVSRLFAENGSKSERMNWTSESDCLAWDDEALARFVGEEEAAEGFDQTVFGY